MHSCYSLDFLNLWTFFFWSHLLLLSLFLYLFSPAPVVCLILFITDSNVSSVIHDFFFEHCIPMMSLATSVMTELKLVCISLSSSSMSSRANFLLMFAWKAFQMSGSFKWSILNLTLTQKFVITRLWLLFMLTPGNALVFALLMPDSELECRFHLVHAEFNIGIPYGFYSWQILADVWLSLVTSLQDGPKCSLQFFHDSWPTLVFQSLWKFMFFLFGW